MPKKVKCRPLICNERSILSQHYISPPIWQVFHVTPFLSADPCVTTLLLLRQHNTHITELQSSYFNALRAALTIRTRPHSVSDTLFFQRRLDAEPHAHAWNLSTTTLCKSFIKNKSKRFESLKQALFILLQMWERLCWRLRAFFVLDHRNSRLMCLYVLTIQRRTEYLQMDATVSKS